MKKIKPLTANEFLVEIDGLLVNFGDDPELCHVALDKAMESLLISLGYGDAVTKIMRTERWYT